jgi:uncharacterized protein YbaP (TraB family)
MNKKKVLFPLVFIMAMFHLSAQETTYPTGSVLWKISGKDLKKPSYILGTFHLKSGEYLDAIPGAKAAFESSKQVIGEVIMTDQQALQALIIPKMMMNSDTNYHQLYSDEDYAFVSEQLKSLFGIGLDRMGMMKPFAIWMNFEVMIYLKSIPNFNPENLLDIYVQQEAIKKKKKVIGLETPEFQYELLGGSSLQEQADQLLCALKNMDTIIAKEVAIVLKSYEEGDLNALADLFKAGNSPCNETQGEIDTLVKDRNDKWMLQLPALMKKKTSFIAVGAGHLCGEVGLLNQLIQQGYTVEAVK